MYLHLFIFNRFSCLNLHSDQVQVKVSNSDVSFNTPTDFITGNKVESWPCLSHVILTKAPPWGRPWGVVESCWKMLWMKNEASKWNTDHDQQEFQIIKNLTKKHLIGALSGWGHDDIIQQEWGGVPVDGCGTLPSVWTVSDVWKVFQDDSKVPEGVRRSGLLLLLSLGCGSTPQRPMMWLMWPWKHKKTWGHRNKGAWEELQSPDAEGLISLCSFKTPLGKLWTL